MLSNVWMEISLRLGCCRLICIIAFYVALLLSKPLHSPTPPPPYTWKVQTRPEWESSGVLAEDANSSYMEFANWWIKMNSICHFKRNLPKAMSIAFIQEIDYCVQVTSPSNTSSKAHVILILLHCSDYTILNTTDLPLPPFLLNIVNVYAVQIHNLLRPFDKAVSSTPLPNRHSMSTQRLSHSQRRKGDI